VISVTVLYDDLALNSTTVISSRHDHGTDNGWADVDNQWIYGP